MTPPAVSEVKSAATQEAIAEEPLLPPKLLLGPGRQNRLIGTHPPAQTKQGANRAYSAICRHDRLEVRVTLGDRAGQ
jgi:hypothetical protein